jgi:hypothetical protein
MHPGQAQEPQELQEPLERSGAGDHFQVEVVAVRSRGGEIATAPEHCAHDSRLTPHERIARLIVGVALIVVPLAAILGSIPMVRSEAAGLLARFGPAPTPTLPAGADLVYLLPNPPGVDVSLDGHVLAQQPVSRDYDLQQVRLARGQHQLAWRSRVFPFRPLQCAVSAPRASGDSCPLVSPAELAAEQVALPGAVIAVHGALDRLTASDAVAVKGAIQAALDAHRSTAVIQPGERYYMYQPAQAGVVVVAQQPLRATLGFQLVTDSGYTEPCIVAGPAVPCRFLLQDCSQLCTVAQPPASVVTAQGGWIVAALVRSSWDYQTLDGQMVAQHVQDSGFGLQLAVLRITLDGARWQATAIFGHTPGFDVADDAVCDPAREALGQVGFWSFMVTNPPVGAQVQFASDGNPADGCMAALNQPPATTEPAEFLDRFGVLLTVNDVARTPNDNLPSADATEQRLSQQLLAQLSPSGANTSRAAPDTG